MTETARRKDSLAAMRLCRFCLSANPSLTDIFGNAGRASGAVPLPLQVMACVAIEVFPSDGMPSTICDLCRHFMDQSYRFKQICKQADESLRHYASHGDQMPTPIEWPEALIKDVPELLKSSKPVTISTSKDQEDIIDIIIEEPLLPPPPPPKKIIKTSPMIKRGRPRKISKDPIVTSIDIENGEKGMPMNIKVTQVGDEVIIDADDDQGSMRQEDFDKDEVPTGVYPCKFCQRSFPLQQLRDIHIKNTHIRDRNHPCSTCDRSFFTKYDLQKHEETHTGVKPYRCLICEKTFLRKTFLQRHEKIHTTAIKYLCSQCDHTFLTSEEMNAHVERRHKKERRFACPQCPKKFAFKQGLERHMFTNHSTEHDYKCDYCSAGFTTPSRLTRHVQTHAGIRPYPCRFCPKSFLLSHHYTRHLRMKHLDKNKNSGDRIKSDGVFARQEDCYKCVQCDKSFCTQDELIFHSAVHATQDLTCPLCKEKFPNVDEVTTHIKSHIEGEQFMCDWCELVFTSEEKLDMHIDSDHQEAMDGDVYKEIGDLEEQLIDGTEVIGTGENTSEEEYDEEDVIYESTQQAEQMQTEQNPSQSQIEFELGADGEVVKVTNVEITFDREEEVAEDEAGEDDEDDDKKRTYTELKPVPSDDLTKKPTEIVQKQLMQNNSSNIQSKADESRNKLDSQSSSPKSDGTKLSFSQRMREQSLKRASTSQVKKENQENQEKQEPSRTTEKSLMLLEKDIHELKKNVTSPDKSTSRFQSFKLSQSNKSDREISSIINKTIKEKMYFKVNDPKVTSTPNNIVVRKRGRPKKIIEKLALSEEEESISSSDVSDFSDTDPSIRRSTRPNKVKDYAALIRDGSNQKGSDSEDEEDEDRLEDDELEEREYVPPTATERKLETQIVHSTAKKRGRPRKNPGGPPPKKKPLGSSLLETELEGLDLTSLTPEQLCKVLKRPVGRPSKKALEERASILGITVDELNERHQRAVILEQQRMDSETSKDDTEKKPSIKENETTLPASSPSTPSVSASPPFKKIAASIVKTLPSGGIVKTLPPGVKPLPMSAQSGAPPGVCEMKIGDKVVRVQKIRMTKAEVEAITKKGLVELKDGAMVLKAGVKLPSTADNMEIKKKLLSEKSEERIASPAGSSSQESKPAADSPFNSSKKDQTPKPTRFTGCSDNEDN